MGYVWTEACSAMYERGWSGQVEEFLARHTGAILLLSALFVIGVIFGALAVRSLEARDRLELVAYLSHAVKGLENATPGTGSMLLKGSILAKLKLLALLWVLGISVVGIFGVMLLTLLRGLLTGFAVAFLTAEMGARGVGIVIAGHLPQSLLEVPAILLAGTASVGFSLQVLQSWQERRRVPQFYRALSTYTGTICLMGLLLVGASLVECYLSPALVRWMVALLA